MRNQDLTRKKNKKFNALKYGKTQTYGKTSNTRQQEQQKERLRSEFSKTGSDTRSEKPTWAEIVTSRQKIKENSFTERPIRRQRSRHTLSRSISKEDNALPLHREISLQRKRSFREHDENKTNFGQTNYQNI